jgi:hypothetical protein
MALFDQYTKPGVYTRESVADPGTILFGDARIPVFIGEGNEEFVSKNQTMHRGSSAVADDLVVKENLSSQFYDGNGVALAPMRQFALTYFPVVKGDGTGTTTNTPSDITILADGAPVVVTALDGATGVFQTQDLFIAGTSFVASYYFKRKDTYFTDDVTSQVPAYATWSTQANLVLTLSNPGALGNNVTLALTKVTPSTDALAVSGIGTDAISIELQQTPRNIAAGIGLTFAAGANSVLRASGSWVDDGAKIGDKVAFNGLTVSANNLSTTILTVSPSTITVAATLTTASIDTGGTTTLTPARTLNDLSNLILSGIATASGGNLVVTSVASGHGTDGAAAVGATTFVGGAGPSSNVTFEVAHLPIVDGSNGGIVTSSASKVSATVNGVAVAVQAVDGPNGLVTLAAPVAYGQTVTVSYYSNNFQDTYDILPASNVTSLTNVGYGPDRSDFTDGSDFTLTTLANGSSAIQWGSAVTDVTGQFTPGFVPFDATHVVPTLVDEKMYLQPVQGVVNGKNTTFTLLDVPTDSSGMGTVTNDPALVQVYVGATPSAALSAGAVRVIQVIGNSKTIKLYNPPVSGTVYASYYRNSLNDHTYTLSVVAAGVTGQGTYKIADENAAVLAPISNGSNAVTEANFVTTGIVWPKSNGLSLPDLNTVAGSSPDETITVTFQDDGLQFPVVLAAQASVLGTTGNNIGLLFTALTPGTAMNGKTVQLISSGTGKADASAIAVVSNNLTIEIVKADNITTRTLAEIITLLSTYHAMTVTPAGSGSEIFASLAAGSGISSSSQVAVMATPAALAGGVNLSQTPYALRYKVTSSKVSGTRTGGVTTPGYPNYITGGTPVGTDGYLNQTFVDAATGVKFTLVNPADALSYGYTSLPSPSYHYRPGDTLTFVTNKATARYTSSTPTIAIPGLKVKVISTYGMRDSNGGLVNPDTNILTTYNKSGNEPAIGDYYYVTYTVAKTDADLALTLYTNPADAYAAYGDPTPSNKLSLAARLYTQNGGQIFGCIQVRKDTGLETASDASYMTAIATLAAPLPGSSRKADMIQPLTTSPVVVQYLNRHLLTQSSQRNSGEATSVFGFDFYATPSSMRNTARSVKSDRLTGMAIPGAILSLDINGASAEYAVGGEMVAAAMAGAIVNPAIDVATTLTRQNLVGFSRLTKRYDDPTMDLMAADGLTCLTENNGAFQIRHWVTTDSSSVLKREPTSRLIVDYTRRQVRKNLDQFIGRKLLQTALNSISIVTSSTLTTLVSNEIIEGYKNLVVTKDAADPTVVHVAFALKPLFSLLWIDVALTVSTSL